MINLEKISKVPERHSFSNVVAFATKNKNGKTLFYIVTDEDDVVELSTQVILSDYQDVEAFASSQKETVLKIYENFDDFELTLTKG